MHHESIAFRGVDCKSSSRESLHVWKMFVDAGFGSKSLPHFCRVSTTQQPFINHFTIMSSPHFRWVVDLEIAGLQQSSSNLKSLADLCNLENLTIRYPKSSKYAYFDDSLVGALAHRAATEGALSRFRMLFVQNATGITKEVFKSLNHFPALDIVCLDRTGVRAKDDDTARSHGWTSDAK